MRIKSASLFSTKPFDDTVVRLNIFQLLPFKEKCISDAVRIGSIFIVHLSKQ